MSNLEYNYSNSGDVRVADAQNWRRFVLPKLDHTLISRHGSFGADKLSWVMFWAISRKFFLNYEEYSFGITKKNATYFSCNKNETWKEIEQEEII